MGQTLELASPVTRVLTTDASSSVNAASMGSPGKTCKNNNLTDEV